MILNRSNLNRATISLVLISAWSSHDVEAQNSSLLYDVPPVARQMQPMFPYVNPQAGARGSGIGNGVTNIPTDIAGPTENPGTDDPRVTINGASWMYQPAPPIRVFRKNDIVTIRVDEVTRMMAEGEAESRKQTLFEAVLSDWIRLSDFRLRPDAQTNGDPSVAGTSNNRFRSESSVESREAMSFNIAATVVDIRENGSLVLEARKNIRVNDNLWETALTGICRPEDIAPDNVVLSRDLIDLEILKEDRGHLRDGYKRGWFSRWFDRVQPF